MSPHILKLEYYDKHNAYTEIVGKIWHMFYFSGIAYTKFGYLYNGSWYKEYIVFHTTILPFMAASGKWQHIY